jgi:ABC-type phosphate transport system auxiliary subunit
MHPNAKSLSELSNQELEKKILKLNGMYFMTNDAHVRQQMILLLDTYKLELEERRLQQKKSIEEPKSDLDKLINVS